MIRVLSKERNEIEIEFEENDATLPELLVSILNEMEEVSFAAYFIPHPLVGKPKLRVKTKRKSPKKVLLTAIEKAISTLEEMKKKMTSSL